MATAAARASWAPATLDATTAGAACSQINLVGALTGSEDCLTLNIWTPATAASGRGLPVLIWLHAGAFLGASANFAPNDGRRFAEERNAVVVTPNYRLGAFGWLAHEALVREDPGIPHLATTGLPISARLFDGCETTLPRSAATLRRSHWPGHRPEA